ncbi:hypothetical protein [Deinococcus aestuarii]|uniref:hypothetical protein n=1 Tax=Deinococcus aestuarii TaxID=2774531 RepID=UPI001C0DE3E4|nr:hypothetical protein [Deinococcus aestuarii]
MSLELLAANLTLRGRADRLSRLNPDARRKEGIRAARDSDVEGLWGLQEAFLVTYGSRGRRQASGESGTWRRRA